MTAVTHTCPGCQYDAAEASLRHRLFARFMAADADLSARMYSDRKRRLFAGVTGWVLEIGPATGVNLPLLRGDIDWTGLEPNPAMHPHPLEKAEALGISADLRTGTAEDLPMPDACVDNVISTLVLCSVADMRQTLAEVLRILKPGGRFLFLEHVADRPWTLRRAVQGVVPYTPWCFFSDGCEPGRAIAKAISGAGSARVEIERFRQEGPGLILSINRPHIAGWAVK